MRKKSLFLVMVLVWVMLAACATFDLNAYKSLESARVTYNQTMSAAGQMWMEGRLTQAQVTEIQKIGNVYYSTYGMARNAYEVYHANPSPAGEGNLTKLLADVSSRLSEVVDYIGRIKSGGVK